jgi:hypothetical protein
MPAAAGYMFADRPDLLPILPTKKAQEPSGFLGFA